MKTSLNQIPSNRELFVKGMKDAIPVCLGYIAVSFSFGIQAKKLGFTLFQAALMSGTNLTSAGQFSGITLIQSGATLFELALTQLIINSRYMLMSGALSQKLDPEEPTRRRMLMAFGISDENFALSFAYPGTLRPVYTYGLMSCTIPGWILGTVLGVLSGDILPASVLDALGLALYGMLIAIIIPPSKKNKVIAGLVIVSMMTNALIDFVPGLKGLSSGMRIILLTLLITAIAAWLFPHKEATDEL